mmetsp:Transcript_19901/g.50716  ORF Transcript_19901/g.50716 Transcript_19901/m.50716 type:complete len:228 (+) Transcript_19901:441-1124(+)
MRHSTPCMYNVGHHSSAVMYHTAPGKPPTPQPVPCTGLATPVHRRTAGCWNWDGRPLRPTAGTAHSAPPWPPRLWLLRQPILRSTAAPGPATEPPHPWTPAAAPAAPGVPPLAAAKRPHEPGRQRWRSLSTRCPGPAIPPAAAASPPAAVSSPPSTSPPTPAWTPRYSQRPVVQSPIRTCGLLWKPPARPSGPGLDSGPCAPRGPGWPSNLAPGSERSLLTSGTRPP